MRMIKQLVSQVAKSNFPQGSIAAPSNCPDCGRPIKLVYHPQVLVDHPILEGLVKIVICNPCADFRQAHSDATEVVQEVMRLYRAKAVGLARTKKTKEALLPELEKLNAEFRPLIESAALRVLRILSRKSGRPVNDHAGWASQLMSVWKAVRTYGGEEMLHLEPVDQTLDRLRAMRAAYGVRIVRHGQPKPEAPKVNLPEPP